MCYRQFPQKPGEEEVTSYLVAQQLGLKPNVLSQEAKGPHFLANIVECASDEVYCDMPVEVTWEDVDEAFSLPKFKPHGDIGQKG